jgi:DNA polymerase-3 subunit gamma/tau
MTQALYRKWRPQTWDDVIGQEHVISSLRNAVAADRVAHAFLFAGPRGTGKTTTARILAKAVNCLADDLAARPCNQCAYCQAVGQGRFLDLIEIDAASNTSVDDVRDLRDKINFSPNQGKYKVYIVDEVHMLSTAAFNALLKTLEEPPPHAIFVLATTEVHKIPATVLSRCQRHEFRRIPVQEIVASLRQMAQHEQIEVDEAALTLIARQATGAMRDAISLLDQLASTSAHITLAMAQSVLGTATNQAVIDLVEALLARQAVAGLDQIHRALDAGSDPRQFARQIVDYLRALLLVRMGNADQIDATSEMRAQMARHAQAFEALSELLRCIRAFNHAANDARLAWQPSLPLELALVESLETQSQAGASPSTPAASPKVAATPKPVSQNSSGAAQPQGQLAPKEAALEEGAATPEAEAEPLPQTIAQNWDQIRSLVRRISPQTQGLLNSCRLLGVKDGALVLGFGSDLLKAKMEQGDHIQVTCQAIAEVLGVEMPVRCVTSTKSASLPSHVDQDGLVATALRDLGGELVDVS